MSYPEAVLIAAALAIYRLALSPVIQCWGGNGGRGLRRSGAVQIAALGVTIGCTVLALMTRDRGVPHAQWPIGAVVVLLTWRMTTVDFDVTMSLRWQSVDRILCLACTVMGLVWPPMLLVWVLVGCARLRAWQHHAKMPMRVVKVYIAWFLADALLVQSGVAPRIADSDAAFLFLAGCVSLSHYLKPAWSKARLGGNIFDWMLHNRTHHLAASAYAWGWARFLPEATVLRLLGKLAPLDRAMNAATLLIEAVFPLIAFAGRRELVSALLATALFNCAIAVASGILFWENIATNAILATAISTAPTPVMAITTGPIAALIAIAVLALAALDRLWQPDHLGWWDTPFTARVHWRLTTREGVNYGLYNDFMSPYEREYGRTQGTFLCSQPIVHGHLGIVWDKQLRDRLAASEGKPEVLDAIKRAYGCVHWDAAESAAHRAYLTAMFAALNQGVRKNPLPRYLRWAKAPGGQLFYWGELPRYRGGQAVARISAWYEERFFHQETGRFSLLRSDHLFDIDLSPILGSPECARSSSTAAQTSAQSSPTLSASCRTTTSTPSNPTGNCLPPSTKRWTVRATLT